MNLQIIRILWFFISISVPAQAQFLSTTISLSDWAIGSIDSVRLGQVSVIHAPGGEQLKVYSLYGSRDDRPTVRPLPLEQSGNCALVSAFDGETMNTLGGGWGAFQRAPSGSSLEYARGDDGRLALRMRYNRQSSGFCGMWIRLSAGSSEDRVYFDSRPFEYLAFWIRGTGGHTILLKAADAAWDRKEDAVAVGDLSTFVSSGRIGPSWQLAVVPLSVFPQSLDRSKLAAIALEAVTEGSGELDLKNLAFCKEPAPLPDLSPITLQNSGKKEKTKSLWVWNTSDIIGKQVEEESLVSFLKKEGFTQVFLALPYDPGLPDARVKIRIDGEKFRPFIRTLTTAGVFVHALIGDKDFVLPENHSFATNSIREVIDYNKESQVGERFEGIHLDVEPYLLPGFGSARRDWILQNFLNLFSKAAATARNGQLRFGADIPAWFDASDELTGASFAIDFGGMRRPLLEHIFDLVDDVALMDYRTEAGGENGVIAHARGELKLGSERGKKVIVGLETEPLPDETITIFRGEPVKRWPAAGSFVSLAKAKDSVIVTLVGSSGLQEFRDRMGARGIEPSETLFWPVAGEYRVEGSKLSFASLGMRSLRETMKQAEPELSFYPAFSGFAIHHYGSYRKMR